MGVWVKSVKIVPESQNRATAENEPIKIVFVSDVI